MLKIEFTFVKNSLLNLKNEYREKAKYITPF